MPETTDYQVYSLTTSAVMLPLRMVTLALIKKLISATDMEQMRPGDTPSWIETSIEAYKIVAGDEETREARIIRGKLSFPYLTEPGKKVCFLIEEVQNCICKLVRWNGFWIPASVRVTRLVWRTGVQAKWETFCYRFEGGDRLENLVETH